ncbi:MAG: TonB-dependent receptor [Flavobacteriales bacterium]
MLKYLLVTIFILLGVVSHSQDASICGKILDANSNQLLGYAHIELHETEQKLMANEQGAFCFERLALGKSYHLHFSFVGYESTSKTIKAIPNKDTVLIYLKPTSFLLPQFTIENEWTRTDADKSSLNVINILPKAIERANTNNFTEVLEKIPGIRSMNTGVGIAKPVIRGMYGNRVMVNENGIRQEGQQWGLDHGLEIDAFNAGRVEVIKGAASMLYGTGANAGVINILPTAVPAKNTFASEVITGYRSNNKMWMGTAMAEGNKNNNFFRARLSYRDFGDYRVPADSFVYNNYVLPIFDRSLKNTAGKERSASLSGGVMRDWGVSRLTISLFNQEAGLFPGAIGIPRFNDIKPDGDSRDVALPRQEVTHLKVLSNTNIQVKNGWLQVDLGWQYNKRLEMSPPHSHGFNIGLYDSLALGLGLNTATTNVKYHIQLKENLKLIAGTSMQWQQNSISGFEFLIPNYNQFQSALFTYLENNFSEKFTINAAFRIDRVEQNLNVYKRIVYNSSGQVIQIEDFSPESRRVFTGLNVGLGVVYLINNQWSLKSNMAQVYRVPDISELASNGVHHGTFRHEMGTLSMQGELGYQADIALTLKKEKLFLQATPFVNYYLSYIYLQPQAEFSALPDAGQLYRYVQHPVFFTGGEVLSEMSMNKQFSVTLTAEYVYNYNLDTYLPLPFTPPFNSSATLNWAKELNNFKLTSHLSYRVFSSAHRVDRNEPVTDGYQITSINFGVEKKIKKNILELSVAVNNLFDTYYMNHLSRYRILNLPEQGRNISAFLKWSFN